MPDHKFRTGQHVNLLPPISRHASGGVYVVTKQLPESLAFDRNMQINDVGSGKLIRKFQSGARVRYIAHEAINSGRAVTEIDKSPQKAFLPGSLTLFLHLRLTEIWDGNICIRLHGKSLAQLVKNSVSICKISRLKFRQLTRPMKERRM
jgi:hypothetical protein